jgi:hypothetical protein
MRTINRTENRSLGIAAAPADVHAYLAEAGNLPAWAPGFASRVSRSGASWLVSRDGEEFTIDVLVEPRSGTVDFVAASDHARGLFARVLPNGDGSEVVFALMFAPDAPEDVVATQLLTLETELAAVRNACE